MNLRGNIPIVTDTQDNSLSYVLGLSLGLGYRIAVPLVVFALAGRWADTKLGTAPGLFLMGVLIAIVTSCIAVYKLVAEIIKESEKS